LQPSLSQHSEAIYFRKNPETQSPFLLEVDAAAVYVNASTAFLTDGKSIWLWRKKSESALKASCRGPMDLPNSAAYKWVVRKGNGQVRN